MKDMLLSQVQKVCESHTTTCDGCPFYNEGCSLVFGREYSVCPADWVIEEEPKGQRAKRGVWIPMNPTPSGWTSEFQCSVCGFLVKYDGRTCGYIHCPNCKTELGVKL